MDQTFAGIAQLVEQWIENPRVRGSNPRPGIFEVSFFSLARSLESGQILWVDRRVTR
jgi:hypothetical protein